MDGRLGESGNVYHRTWSSWSNLPWVLAGHCVGDLVLKEVSRRADQVESSRIWHEFIRQLSERHERFIFLFHKPVGISPTRGFENMGSFDELLSKDSARLNQDSSEVRKRPQYGWKTWGVIGANEIEPRKIVQINNFCINRLSGRKHQSLLMVEEGAARHNMVEFCVLLGEDHASNCKQKDQNSSTFQVILKFVEGIHENEEFVRQWRTNLEFPQVYMSMPARIRGVITLLQLDQPEPCNIYLVGMGGIGKSTLAKEVTVKIRSQFDVFCFVKDVKSRLKEDNLHNLIAANLYHGNGLKSKCRMVANQQVGKFGKF